MINIRVQNDGQTPVDTLRVKTFLKKKEIPEISFVL
jgi:hypothetical protein